MIESILEISGLSYGYPGRMSERNLVLKDLSFGLNEGEFLTLLGPNGCGKSTLMKLIAGILPWGGASCSGAIRFRCGDFTRAKPAVRARTIAYLGAEFRTEFPMSAYEAVMLARTAAGAGFADRIGATDHERVRWAMESCQCWSWRERNLQTLSGGERQLVGLARALAQGAKILFLDESLSQMDLHHQSHVGKMLKGLTLQGWSVVLVAHDVNLASEWADSALLMNRGEKVAQGAVAEVLTEDHLRRLYPGAGLMIGAHPITGAPKIFFGRGRNAQ